MTVYDEVQARLDLRGLIVDAWQTAFPDVQLFDSRGMSPNLDTLPALACFRIDLLDSEPIAMGPVPIDRTWGSIIMDFGVREQEGESYLASLRAAMKAALKSKKVGGLKTLIPKPGPGWSQVGWDYLTLTVPFYFDSNPVA